MKFSVLLPTRNRLEYLRYAIETVLRQDYRDWEIIVSDNCSEDDIAGYVRCLNDSRIIYVRTEHFVPVTENWNNALEYSSGDYVVMLGDDDGLLPSYFSKLSRAFEDHPNADYVYLGAYFFAYRGAVPEDPAGFLRRDRNGIFIGENPYWLDKQTAQRIGRSYLDFKMPIASNMQFSLISRRMIQKLSEDGPFFRSPFPDFYATPLLFLRSKNILIYSAPMVVVGITPKSYGAFHFSGRTNEGTKFLQNEEQLNKKSAIQATMLPGTSYYDSWLLAAEALSRRSDSDSQQKPNFARYRFLQILHNYKHRYFDRQLSAEALNTLKSRMSSLEKLVYSTTLPTFFIILRCIPTAAKTRAIAKLRNLLGQHKILPDATRSIDLENMLSVYEFFAAANMQTPAENSPK